MNRCSAGSMIKSFPEMAYHDGRVCHATASGKFYGLALKPHLWLVPGTGIRALFVCFGAYDFNRPS